MSVLVVGSVALDSVETPFGKADDVLGGSATFFSASASHLTAVQLVGVVGNDYPMDKVARTREAKRRPRRDRAGGRQLVPLARSVPARSQLRGDARDASRRLLALRAEDSGAFRETRISCSSPTSTRGCSSTCSSRSSGRELVACDTMNFWIESRRPELLELLAHVDLITLNDAEARQLTEQTNLVKAARWIMARGPKHVIIKKGEHGAFMFQLATSSSRRHIRSNRCSIPRARVIRSPADSWDIWRAPAT